MALLTEYDVVNMRFKEPKRADEGYDQDEVDYFLDEVAETIAHLTREKNELTEKLQAAEARITELENAGEATPDAAVPAASAADSTLPQAAVVQENAENATGVLALAQKLHDEYVANGKAESERLIAEAEVECNRIRKETEENRSRTVAKLEEVRSVMEHKISELRDFERDYRTRLKSYLESLLNNVNSQNPQGSDI